MSWCAALLPVFMAACGGESGIVVDVRSDETVTTPIKKLVFVEGLSQDGDLTLYQQDQLDGVVEIEVVGRDLVADGYRMMYRDGAGTGRPFIVAVLAKGEQGEIVAFGAMVGPVAFQDGKVLEVPITLSAGFDGLMLETGCLEYWTGDEKVVIHPGDDTDCDGSRACDVAGGTECDCDDGNWSVHPGAPEDCFTVDIDEDCDGDPMEDVDEDLDGVTTCGGDCNDLDDEIAPGNLDKCDGKDNDCNELCDDGSDFDGDSFTVCQTQILLDGTCIPAAVGDCDDTNPEAHEGHVEVCDGVDNDCNEVCDDAAGANGGEPLDVDGDGYTLCGTIPGRCLDPNPSLVDCEPTVGEVHPFAAEACDGFDTNCDGMPMTTTPCFGTFEKECAAGTATCDDTGGEIGDCAGPTATDTAPAPDALCAAYDTCLESGSTNPFECALETSVPVVHVDCMLHHTEFGVLCPERNAPMTGDPDALVCRWSILGGRFQPHYEVALSSPLTPTPSDSIEECDGSFGVLDKRDVNPQPDTVFLSYQDDLVGFDPSFAQLVRVSITPLEVASCDASSGLQCSIAIP